MSHLEPFAPEMYRCASPDADEIGALVSGASLREGELFQFSGRRTSLADYLPTVDLLDRSHGYSNKESGDGSYDPLLQFFARTCDSGYASYQCSPEECESLENQEKVRYPKVWVSNIFNSFD